MSLNARLNAVEHERYRRCVNCGGVLAVAPSGRWQSVMAQFKALPDEEFIAFAAHYGLTDRLPPALRERARHQVPSQNTPGVAKDQ